ncbi:MAG: DUF1501 domain-containing protein, partial [Verrucomicrobiota bacterium]
PTAGHFTSGLSNEDFFRRYGEELLVYNGLDYSINNHSPCSRYMATGKLDSLAYPTFAALVAACKGKSCPLAFLTFGNYSGTGNLVPMSRVPYLPTLKLVANADYVQGNANHPFFDDFASDEIEKAMQRQQQLHRAKNKLPRAERATSILFGAQTSSKALRRVVPHIPKTIPKDRLAQQAEIALASFKAGVCVSANLNIGQFDSHQNNDRDQLKLIPEFLEGIDYTLKRAETIGLRDKLVVVIQSEMGRTPHYNNGQGKDHWSIGSIMFLGAGVKGNRVLGQTDGGQFARPFDPRTLKVTDTADQGIRIRPQHIQQALRELAGIDNHALAKKFPLEVHPSEALNGFFG